jgi:tetratricopeptide (TPR) repeat protein
VLGSTTLRGSRADLVLLQEDLAREVSVFLRQRLGHGMQELLARAGTRSGRAWEQVQYADWRRAGVGSLLEGGDTTAATRQLARADSTLAAAAQLDPAWPAPVVRRGWLAYEQRHIAGFDKGAAAQWLGRGATFAEQALEIAPGDAEAHRLRGTLRYVRWVLNLNPAPFTADELLVRAEADLRAGADTSNPNRASALALLSHLLLRRSATAEGKVAAQQAYEADPYLQEAPDVLNRLFLSSVDLEDATEATRWCEEGYRRYPDRPIFTECQITVGALPGQHPDINRAWQLLDRSVAMYPPHAREYRRKRGELLVGLALARAGLADSARAVAQRARADAAVDPTRDLVYIEAMLRNQLNDRDEALHLIAQ